ncbi:MAG: binding-protein-dependent transport system inner rane protein [Acidimicrobiaceae bacterium]|nr:binding-protein-dependent transport system inner rane protein [Acidimicrobiaceae bacterium]
MAVVTAGPPETSRGRLMSKLAKRRTANGLTLLALILGAAFILLPIFWLVDTAFKPVQLAFLIPPHFLYRPTLGNFQSLISGQDSQYVADMLHSVIIMLVSVGIALVLGTPAGYSLARSRFRGSGAITGWLIVAYIVPALVYIVPLYAIYQKFNISGSYLAVILYYETFELPFVVFMMRSYFADVPVTLDEAARVDGATRFQAFRKVLLPLVLPGLSTVTILAAITSWGEYFGALIFTGPSTTTAPVALQNYVGLETANWSTLAAAALFLVVPVLALTGVAQRGYLRTVTSATTG